MAHQFFFKPSQMQLSSMLGDFNVLVDGDYVDVALTSSRGNDLFTGRYYPYNSKVTLCDLGSLIEADMRTKSLSFAEYTLSVFTDTRGSNGDSCLLKVMYCDRLSVCQDVELFLQENFLTTLQMRRIAPDGAASLCFYAKAGESTGYALDVTYRTRGVALQSQRFSYDEDATASANTVITLDVAPGQLLAKLENATDCEIVSVTATAGQRSATFYVDASLNSRSSAPDLRFRNCFNVVEDLRLQAVTTAKTDVDRSTAIIGGKSQFYNQSSSKSYEVQSSSLTSDEAEWIDQLFTSHEVWRKVYSPVDDETMLLPVLITDSTCELHDGDDSLNTVKFTWRYTDNRPMVLLSASQEIFSDNYDNVYS